MIIRHTEPGTTSDEQSFLIRSLIRRGKISLAGNRRLKIYGTLGCASGKKCSPATGYFSAAKQRRYKRDTAPADIA